MQDFRIMFHRIILNFAFKRKKNKQINNQSFEKYTNIHNYFTFIRNIIISFTFRILYYL